MRREPAVAQPASWKRSASVSASDASALRPSSPLSYASCAGGKRPVKIAPCDLSVLFELTTWRSKTAPRAPSSSRNGVVGLS